MPTYELELGNGDVLEFDSPNELGSQQEMLRAVIPQLVQAGTPEAKQALVALQKQIAPTPWQQASQVAQSGLQATRDAVGPVLSTVRDKATGAVANAVRPLVTPPQGTNFLPAAMNATPEEKALAAETGKQNAESVAKHIVPQDLSTAGIMAGTTALGGVPGLAGAALRTGATPVIDMTMKALAGEDQDLLDTLIKTGTVGAVEGLGWLVMGMKGKKLGKDAQIEIGKGMAKDVGNSIGRETSFKGIDTPAGLMAGVSASRMKDTQFYEMAQKVIQESEDALLDGTRLVQAKAIPAQHAMATRILEAAADVSPTTIPGKGSGLIITGTLHRQPNELLEMAINRARRVREEAAGAEFGGATGTTGMTAHDLWEKYNTILGQIDNGLKVLDPNLAIHYRSMQNQFKKDYNLTKILFEGRDQIFDTGPNEAVFLTPEFAKFMSKRLGDLKKAGLEDLATLIATRGGGFGAGDQRWSIAPRLGSPTLPGGKVAETLSIQGLTKASPTPGPAPTPFFSMPPLMIRDAQRTISKQEEEERKKRGQ